MDSPDSKINSSYGLNNNDDNNRSKKVIAGSSTDSPIVQDSPFFKYISNLSPIEPVKGAPVALGFSFLSSPPLVFTSPHENIHPTLLKRSQESNPPGPGISETDDKYPKRDEVFSGVPSKLDCESSDALIPAVPKICLIKDLEQVQPNSPSVCVDEFLADVENEEYANSTQRKQFDYANESSHDESAKAKDPKYGGGSNPDGYATSFAQGEKYSQGVPRSEVGLTKSKSWLQISSSTDNSDIVANFSTDHAFEMQIMEYLPMWVSCRAGMCSTPLHVTSSQLIASEIFPEAGVKALLYPGAIAHRLVTDMTVPSWKDLPNIYNLTNVKEASAVTDLQRLELLLRGGSSNWIVETWKDEHVWHAS